MYDITNGLLLSISQPLSLLGDFPLRGGGNDGLPSPPCPPRT
jgi:hypothetical protein